MSIALECECQKFGSKILLFGSGLNCPWNTYPCVCAGLSQEGARHRVGNQNQGLESNLLVLGFKGPWAAIIINSYREAQSIYL